ncbi:hypothetical protein HK105_202682 [Polyrhizophydium stewartii]|uniref:Uncharacterized protein n=1 Tax=Polyrhizophydium stewartii TaxID=2732419 RepID=A0ABR4NEC0_9FUNG
MDVDESNGGSANAARQQTNRKRQSPRVNNRMLPWTPPSTVKPRLEGDDRMVARNYDAKDPIVPWGLRHRDHCDTIWCRDKNACINKHKRAMFYPQQPQQFDAQGVTLREDGPLYLRTQQQQHAQA